MTIEEEKSTRGAATSGTVPLKTASNRSPSSRSSSPRKFAVVRSTAAVDQMCTLTKETHSTLNYITPHFRAEAEVQIGPLGEGEVYTIGWVQAVTSMVFTNTYPTGQSSWEIQELNTGETVAVSDADGRKYPWYGITTECQTVSGPDPSHRRIKVLMNDNFSPTVSWAVPVGRDQPDALQRVHRDQSFLVWLIVKNEITGAIQPLKAYRWRAIINIAVDCSREIGQRAKVLEPKIQAQPLELFDLRIPQSAVQSPRANEAQKFVWRTRESEMIFEVSCNPPLPPTLQPCLSSSSFSSSSLSSLSPSPSSSSLSPSPPPSLSPSPSPSPSPPSSSDTRYCGSSIRYSPY